MRETIVDRAYAKTLLPPRKEDGHKGDFGKLLVLGGSVGYTGAPYLAASAAVHSGCGLVYLGVPESIWAVEAQKCVSAMPFPLPETDGRLCLAALDKMQDKLKGCDVLALGPGLGRGKETEQLVHALLWQVKEPLVLDADGNEVDTTDLTTDVDSIEVELDVVKYKQVPLSVNFIDGGGATGADADVDIDPKSITLAGDATVLDSVNTIVLGNVDLGATDNNAVLSFDIKIPNDAKNVSGEESATVTIKIKNKRTKVIGATNIAFINTPDGFDARSITQLVQTTVRASNNEIDRIAANNLRVVADLSEYTQAGTYQVPVTIYIDGYPDAGVIGDDYKIVVVLEAVE